MRRFLLRERVRERATASSYEGGNEIPSKPISLITRNSVALVQQRPYTGSVDVFVEIASFSSLALPTSCKSKLSLLLGTSSFSALLPGSLLILLASSLSLSLSLSLSFFFSISGPSGDSLPSTQSDLNKQHTSWLTCILFLLFPPLPLRSEFFPSHLLSLLQVVVSVLLFSVCNFHSRTRTTRTLKVEGNGKWETGRERDKEVHPAM